MTKKILKSSPLVHVVISLGLSENPNLVKPTEELIVELQKHMLNLGFAEKLQSETRLTDILFESGRVQHQEVVEQRVLFRKSGETEILEITKDRLTLKTTSYTTFDDFHRTFTELLEVAQKVIPDTEKTLLKSIGLRYIDVIAPKRDKSLADYITHVTAPDFTKKLEQDYKHLQGASLKAIETAPGQVLKVTFEEISHIDNKVHKLLPQDLGEKDPKCGLIIKSHPNWDQVNDTYGILDIHHSHEFAGSPPFDCKSASSKLTDLHSVTDKVFWESITRAAMQDWELEET